MLQIMHKILKILVLAVCFVAVVPEVYASETASQIARRSAQLLQRASGIMADFTLESQGKTLKGKLESQGKKFAITTPATSIWFDGKTMWTYNSATQETTVTIPTAREIAETNPLSLVQGNMDSFTCYFAKKQPSKGRRLVLMPKNNQYGVKSVAISISDGTYMPYNIVVMPKNGQPTTVHIKSLETKTNFSPYRFVYPSGKYPKAEIVDLR